MWEFEELVFLVLELEEFYSCHSHHFCLKESGAASFHFHLSQTNWWTQFVAASPLPAMTSPGSSGLGVTGKPNRPAARSWAETEEVPHFLQGERRETGWRVPAG